MIHVISVWSHIDGAMWHLLEPILDAEHSTIARMLVAVPKWAREAAILKASERLTTPERHQFLQTVFTYIREMRKHRNKYAHSIIAYSPEVPGKMLLIDPEHLFVVGADHEATLRSNSGKDPSEQEPHPTVDPKQVFVYDKGDIEADAIAGKAILTLLERLYGALYAPPDIPIPQELYQRKEHLRNLAYPSQRKKR